MGVMMTPGELTWGPLRVGGSIHTPFGEGTLDSLDLLSGSDYGPSGFESLPDVNVIKVGGQSFFDRGRAAVWPLGRGDCLYAKQHKIIVGIGRGHAFSPRLQHRPGVGLNPLG